MLGVVRSVGFDKRVLTCICHYHIIQSASLPYNLCTLPIHPFFCPDLWQPVIFLLFPQFCFSRGIFPLKFLKTFLPVLLYISFDWLEKLALFHVGIIICLIRFPFLSFAHLIDKVFHFIYIHQLFIKYWYFSNVTFIF